MNGVLLDTLRIALAAYLLAVAIGAVFGFHRPLITYPIRVAYSTFALVIEFLSRGHVHLMAPARKARRRGTLSLRNVRERFVEWHVERAEGRGDVVETPAMTWQSAEPSGGVSRESPFEAALAPAPLCPVHGVPLSSPLLFDEATGARYPDGTTHAQVCLATQPALPPAQTSPPSAQPAPPTEERRPVDGASRPPVSSPWDDDEEATPPRFRG